MPNRSSRQALPPWDNTNSPTTTLPVGRPLPPHAPHEASGAMQYVAWEWHTRRAVFSRESRFCSAPSSWPDLASSRSLAMGSTYDVFLSSSFGSPPTSESMVAVQSSLTTRTMSERAEEASKAARKTEARKCKTCRLFWGSVSGDRPRHYESGESCNLGPGT